MLTIYVSPRDEQIMTVDGRLMTVKDTFVRGEDSFVSLQDWHPSHDPEDIEVVILRRFFCKKLRMSPETKAAMLRFIREYHAKQDVSFDCYAFVNLAKGIAEHRVKYILAHWNLSSLPWRLRADSVIFLLSGENRFHHAAIYLGSGLYISVWGAGGDLEIATLKAMKRDYGASEAVLAHPKP